MAAVRKFYLSLGSNILPEQNLRAALGLLRKHGVVSRISSVWESQAVGSAGPNFLNVSVCFEASDRVVDMKRDVVDRIEEALGRTRTEDKNAPRTIDIDILLEDAHPVDAEHWAHAFVILPMAELLPEFPHPSTGRPLSEEAPTAAASLWIQRRHDVTIS
jgi:2-amino-4-hydroxy-6-hydroxymethyldihydropteridine diphosphokinase